MQVGFSYTYSHATDEQTAMGLFYNGNNPLDLRSGYGLSDYDRKHVINFELPLRSAEVFLGVIMEEQGCQRMGHHRSDGHSKWPPYSVDDYSGAVGSIFYRRKRRHNESHRSALRQLLASEGHHRALGCVLPANLRLTPVVSPLPLLSPGAFDAPFRLTIPTRPTSLTVAAPYLPGSPGRGARTSL